MRRLLLALLAVIPLVAYADESLPRIDRDRDGAARHFILTAEHTLLPQEKAALAAEGVEIQHILPERRYVVRATNADVVAHDPRVASLNLIAPSEKIERSAYREAALARPFARVRVLFHGDVSFDDARRVIEQVGGSVDQPLESGFGLPQRIAALIPFASLGQVAADDRVLAVFGPPRKIVPLNAVAAQLSHVTPLFSAPYNLSGSGVVVSEFEFAKADAGHPEFGGRLDITNAVGSDSGSVLHATHVAGTIGAAGLDPNAKGMAPSVKIFEFNANENYPDVLLQSKKTKLAPLSIVADNNSWGFPISWQNSENGWVWYGFEDEYGAYDPDLSTPYDALAKTSTVLFIQSAGNDGSQGQPILPSPYSNHSHVNDNGDVIQGETFCYSLNGSGTDCQVPCTQTPGHCETTKHPTHGAFNTMGPTSVLKNVIAVGATNPDGSIASFSSRGPTGDGRVKPDIVAKGNRQYSTTPGGSYGVDQGTSMSAPVITGIAALLVEQWRKTFGGQNPSPEQLKMVLIAGADDRGPIGPDYTYGFGLANAQASVDLMIADNNTGSRIRTGNIAQGQQIDTPLVISSPQNLRVVVGWIDPEVLLTGSNAQAKTLVNDLDLKIVDPTGNAVLPYVLDPANPTANATHGVNTVDNTEEVEIPNAAPGTYHLILAGTNVASAPTVQYVLIANAQLGPAPGTCTPIATDVRVTYSGTLSGCTESNNRPCQAGEPIQFTALSSTRQFQSCDVFTWTFGDAPSTPLVTPGPTATHTFPAGSVRTARVSISNTATPAAVAVTTEVAPVGQSTCTPTARTLCFVNNRYSVTVDAVDNPQRGNGTSVGAATSKTPDTGFFTLPGLADASDIQVVVKVLDFGGQPLMFYGALTDTEIFINVFDTQSGTNYRLYKAPGVSNGGFALGNSGQQPVETCQSPKVPESTTTVAPGTCAVSSTALCLNNNRFRVSMTATNPQGQPVAANTIPHNDTFGFFNFQAITGNANNLEAFAKVVGPISGLGYIVFYGGLTDLEYRIAFTNTATGLTKTYLKPGRPTIPSSQPSSACGGFDTFPQ